MLKILCKKNLFFLFFLLNMKTSENNLKNLFQKKTNLEKKNLFFKKNTKQKNPFISNNKKTQKLKKQLINLFQPKK